MLLFRSEEDVEEWCQNNARPLGAVVPISLLQRLAQDWYGDRLNPAWKPRSRDESQAILSTLGLSGPFWRLP